MRRVACGAVALAFLFSAGVAEAQSPVRRAAERVLGALSGDEAERRAVVRDSFAPSLLETASAEEWVDLLGRAGRTSGGAAIVDVRAETERFAEFTLRARDAPRFAWLVLGVSRADPSRISTLYLLPGRDPAAARADRWPNRRVETSRVGEEIERRIDNLAREDVFSGAVLVARRGRVVAERYVGMADREAGALIDRRTQFNLASAGKMFTAVAIGRLLEDGRINLDDTVGEWIPDYPDPLGRAITISQLLSHTSGLADFFGPAYRAAPARYQSSESYLPLIAQPPLFEPGAQFAYSNAGFALLGVIIERASGEDYFGFVDRAVFRSARMSGAGFPALDQADPWRAVGYFRPVHDPFGMQPRLPNHDAIAFRGNAAGGAYATARDMLAFSRALMSDRLLSPRVSALLLEPRNDFAGAGSPSSYGFGFATRLCSGRAFVGHGGGGPQSGVNSTLLMSRDGEWTIVVLSNYDAMPDDVAQSICEFVALQ